MAQFLAIKRERLQWATREKIVERAFDGSYHPEVVTAQWLRYERKRAAQKSGRSELEKQRIRFVKAKADAQERRLALLDHALVNGDDMVASVKTVCLRIRSKLQAALPRIARSCYHSANVTESLKNARGEFDVLLAELSTLESGDVRSNLEIVADANGESPKRSAAEKDPDGSAA
jgi:hypothetical protein